MKKIPETKSIGDFLKKKINDIEINYIDEGQGDCIVLLHGWGSNITLFKQMIQYLSVTHRVVALDMPGFGESEEPKSSWEANIYVDFLTCFLKELKIEKASFLGHSFGGMVAIKLAAKRDSQIQVQKLILIGSRGVKQKRSLKVKIKIRFFKICKKIFSITILNKMYPNLIEDMRKKNGSTDYNAASPIMRESLVKVLNENVEDLFKNIKQETLLIWGENDTATPIREAKIMEQKIPNAGLVIIKKATHYVFLEYPNHINKIISSFIDGEKRENT